MGSNSYFITSTTFIGAMLTNTKCSIVKNRIYWNPVFKGYYHFTEKFIYRYTYFFHAFKNNLIETNWKIKIFTFAQCLLWRHIGHVTDLMGPRSPSKFDSRKHVVKTQTNGTSLMYLMEMLM